jgi:hypothetical protein
MWPLIIASGAAIITQVWPKKSSSNEGRLSKEHKTMGLDKSSSLLTGVGEYEKLGFLWNTQQATDA